MLKILLVFEGGSRGSPGAGFGSYAIIKNNQRTITRLEFGSGMTGPEAEYDTLINGLETLIGQENPAETVLEIRCTSQLIVNQVKGTWRVSGEGLVSRRDRARDLLRRFKGYSLKRKTRDQIRRLLYY